jgi:hypothetical protein
MTNNATVTVFTSRGKRGNRALKAIEDMRFAAHDNLKSLIVLIVTLFTNRHTHSYLPFYLYAKQTQYAILLHLQARRPEEGMADNKCTLLKAKCA